MPVYAHSFLSLLQSQSYYWDPGQLSTSSTEPFFPNLFKINFLFFSVPLIILFFFFYYNILFLGFILPWITVPWGWALVLSPECPPIYLECLPLVRCWVNAIDLIESLPTSLHRLCSPASHLRAGERRGHFPGLRLASSLSGTSLGPTPRPLNWHELQV